MYNGAIPACSLSSKIKLNFRLLFLIFVYRSYHESGSTFIPSYLRQILFIFFFY